MWWWSARSGATKARARSSIGCPSRPTSSCASRAATTPAIRSSSTAVTYKLSLLPSGVVRPGKLSVIGNGVVLDPRALIEEIERLKEQGVAVTPRQSAHRRERHADPAAAPGTRCRAREGVAARARIGTTGRGIGPAYEDKVGRRAIRLMDLADLQMLNGKIERLLAHHNALRRGLGMDEIDAARGLRRARRRRAEGAALHGLGLVAARRQAARGQAHPVRGRAGRAARHRPRHLSFVTSSNTVAAQAATGSGSGPARSATCSASARPTRRASAPGRSRPSRTTRSADCIGERGREFGTVTGRPRRCGWFDAVLVRQTVRTSGINGIALTKLDILDGFDGNQGLRRLSARRPGDRLSSGQRACPGPGRADL